jgi:hypothetical protein
MSKRRWGILLPIAAVLVVGSHGFALHYLSSHIGWSAGALSGVVVLALFKHLGLLAPLYAMFRRRQR